MKTDKIIIYTDGSCNNADHSRGGYGIVMINGTVKKYCGGQYDKTTSSRMELLAIVRALQKCKENQKIVVYSDSAYCVNTINERWLWNWAKRNFKTCKNGDLMKELFTQYKRVSNGGRGQIQLVHVRGHKGDFYNEMADKLARQGSKRETIIIDQV